MIDRLAEHYYERRKYEHQRPWADLRPHEQRLWQEVVDQVLEVARADVPIADAIQEADEQLTALRTALRRFYDATDPVGVDIGVPEFWLNMREARAEAGRVLGLEAT